jgi:hypothetical protein
MKETRKAVMNDMIAQIIELTEKDYRFTEFSKIPEVIRHLDIHLSTQDLLDQGVP